MPTTLEQLDAAYRRLTLQYHPDWSRECPGLDPKDQAPAIALLSHALEILHEPFLANLADNAVSSDRDIAQTVHWGRPPLSRECMFCASTPSTSTSLRHQEAFFIDRYRLRAEGPMCQACGLALVKRMQTRSLWAGWWGLRSFFTNLAVIASNLVTVSNLLRLGPPQGREESIVSLLDRPMQA